MKIIEQRQAVGDIKKKKWSDDDDIDLLQLRNQIFDNLKKGFEELEL